MNQHSQQASVAVRVVDGVIAGADATHSETRIRQIAAASAVFVAAAQVIEADEGRFDPFFSAFWSALGSRIKEHKSGLPEAEPLSDLVEQALPIVHRGRMAVSDADQLRFGAELARFIDPAVDTSLASVSAPTAIAFGHQLVAAATLLRALPAEAA